jgi:hypothetical protein
MQRLWARWSAGGRLRPRPQARLDAAFNRDRNVPACADGSALNWIFPGAAIVNRSGAGWRPVVAMRLVPVGLELSALARRW